MLINIYSDNGYEECLTCVFIETNTCSFCKDADHYEDSGEFFGLDEQRGPSSLRTRELIVA